MLDGLVPDLAPRLLIAIGGVAVAFLVLIAVLLFLRRRNSPLFVKGGRAREQTRRSAHVRRAVPRRC